MAPIGAKLRQNTFQTICNFRFFDAEKKQIDEHFRCRKRFSSFSVDFGGVRRVLTSKSDSLMNFASGTQFFRFVRRLELSFVRLFVRSFVVRSFVRRLANFNFAKAGARLGPAVRSDGGGPSRGKIKI